MISDIEIAQKANMKPIAEIAESVGILPDEIELYGKYKAKITDDAINRLKDKKDGKLILVTAINPTPAGEGKTTTTVALGQGFAKIGKSAVIALREPSLGPVMGVKGGAAGGGYSQVVPMEDINLHFTGDMHAITAANNLLSAMLDNHIMQGNELDIDVNNVPFKRVLDMNDRALRNVIVGLGKKVDGVPREEGFTITVASEIMAILCLAEDINDLKTRLGNILIAYNRKNEPVFARDIKAAGAMTVLLKDAIKPNLVQTLENTPCVMHGGPFANIAHGCNSVRGTKLALKLGDYCITEAGFGADLGAEKFLDIKCRLSGLVPSAIVIVATVRALKYNACVAKQELRKPNLEAVKYGIMNLDAHIDNMQKYGVPVVVAVNTFETDSSQEVLFIIDHCMQRGIYALVSEGFARGGDGAINLANKVVEVIDKNSKENKDNEFKLLYKNELPIEEKIETIVKEIYGGKNVVYTSLAEKQIMTLEKLGFSNMPICIAKTQYSLSDNPLLLGRPSGFTVTIREVKVSSGAGFIVAIAGDIMTMPGLPKQPSAEKIDILDDGTIVGLF